ncbi:hypothetical protein O9433_06000 [Proteus mirabilis]|uniref:RipA family octameric membrane protein n=1 Tax=Proteus mirabilis TaxID=584 RepID=UPI0025767631|nr:hypothetical protein [Proteus mirabilis]MDM3712848.1 hypothetical protein [Proteus mirabilis]
MVQRDSHLKTVNAKDYNKLFDVHNRDSKTLEAAFKQASDIRKFEIELYWKRATYFWALIVVAFAGYFSVLSIDMDKLNDKYLVSLVISCTGFVFTFAWFLSGKGSKYWQENWENHLDLLENKITGPLYKTKIGRKNETRFIEKYITGPSEVSVSKINQWVALYVGIIWLFLCIYSGCKLIEQDVAVLNAIFLISLPLVSVLTCFFMLKKGRAHIDSHNLKIVTITSMINQPEHWISSFHS